MKSRSAKNKGKRLQNSFRDLLLETFTQLEPDDIRSAIMGESGEDIKLSPNGGAIMASERDNIIIPPEKEIAILKNYYKQLDSRFDQSHCIGKLAESKAECETDQVRYGKVERAGIWDTPCKKDSDCPFFKANKNYPNEYGSCL